MRKVLLFFCISFCLSNNLSSQFLGSTVDLDYYFNGSIAGNGPNKTVSGIVEYPNFITYSDVDISSSQIQINFTTSGTFLNMGLSFTGYVLSIVSGPTIIGATLDLSSNLSPPITFSASTVNIELKGIAFNSSSVIIINLSVATGACCLPDGSCTIDNEGDCTAVGGNYQGDDTDCATSNCPVTIPTLSQWGLIILGLCLSVIGLVVVKQGIFSPV